jgi:hypothetical protein
MFCLIKLCNLCLKMLRKGLEDDQVLPLHHMILEQHEVVKAELKTLPNDMMVLLKTAVIRSDMAQRRLLLQNQHFPSQVLPFEELLPDGWNRYKSCLAAAHRSLSPRDRQKTEGAFQQVVTLLELHELVKDFIVTKRPVHEFWDDVASRPEVLNEHTLRLSIGRTTSWKEILRGFQEKDNSCSYKAVALQVEDLCASIGQCFSGAAGINSDVEEDELSEDGEVSPTEHEDSSVGSPTGSAGKVGSKEYSNGSGGRC